MLKIYNKNSNKKYFYFVNSVNNVNCSGGAAIKSKTNFFLSVHFMCVLFVVIISLGLIDMANAGTCWEKRNQSGKCKQPIARNVTKEDCCTAGDDVGFSEKEMSQYEYFFATAIGDGTTCSSCIDSCENANCGPHKRCVMRSGQPKCVCAPKCKSVQHRNDLDESKHRHLAQTGFSKSKRGDAIAQNENHERNFRPRMQSPSNGQRVRDRHHQRFRSSNRHISSSTPRDVQLIPHRYINRNVSMTTQINRNASTTPSRNNLNSHRFRKNKINSNSSNPFVSDRNVYSNEWIKSNSVVMPNVTVHAAQHRHRKSKHGRKEYFQRMDENGTWDDEKKSLFSGHDMPYPPIDMPEYENHQYNHHRAVCGTDGKTYKTECQLRKRACRQESTSLTIAYKGQCQTSCKKVHCPAGRHCLEDQNLMPHCVMCSMNCPPYDPAIKSVIPNPARLVCGADGNTYRNLCEIKRTACMLGRSIPVAYRGPCKEAANCSNIKCKDRQICLNDLVTHRPRCVSCSFKCPRRKRPQGQQSAHIKLCGVNDKSYHSWCQMMKDSCNTGLFIDVKHNGVCQKATRSMENKKP